MICVYLPNCNDFSTNGLGPVSPISCTVTETLNGEWELQMEHPIDAIGKWERLLEGRILRAPVPAATTPRVKLAEAKHIYRIKTSSSSLRLRAGAAASAKSLGSYRNGTEVVVLSTANATWYEVACPDGKRGFMNAVSLVFVRTEDSVEGKGKVIEPKQLRDQPFRIYRIVPSLDKITVYARHVFYDLADNMIKSYKPDKTVTGAEVAQSLGSQCQSAHDFTFYSDLAATADEPPEFEHVNPVDALLGEDGFTEKYVAELARDWFDVYLVERVGSDTDIQIREGKNLLGIRYDVDESDVVTRIMPTGQTKDGKALYLDELYIDSPRIGNYPHPKWIHLDVSEAKVGKDLTTSQAKAKIRTAVQAEYDKGCDLPALTVSIEFVNSADTEEYAQYQPIQNIFLGDAVRAIARRIGVDVYLRMTEYTYDCLTRKYTKVTLGVLSDTIESSTISSRQLPSGSITGTKLARGSIGPGQLQDGSVGSLKIETAAIELAHISQAAITDLSAASIAALTATIDTIISEQITTDALYVALAEVIRLRVSEITVGTLNSDELYAELARIMTLRVSAITAATIGTDALYAKLADVIQLRVDQAVAGNLSAASLRSALAQISRAEIALADIDWASIKDLVTGSAIIREGEAGKLYIDKLAVTDANIVSMTANKLSAGVIDAADIEVVNLKAANITVGTINGQQIAQGAITAGNIAQGAVQTEHLGQGVITADAIAAGAITGDKIPFGAVAAEKLKLSQHLIY